MKRGPQRRTAARGSYCLYRTLGSRAAWRDADEQYDISALFACCLHKLYESLANMQGLFQALCQTCLTKAVFIVILQSKRRPCIPERIMVIRKVLDSVAARPPFNNTDNSLRSLLTNSVRAPIDLFSGSAVSISLRGSTRSASRL